MPVVHMNSDKPGGTPTMCGRGRSGTWDAPAVTCKACTRKLEAAIQRTQPRAPWPGRSAERPWAPPPQRDPVDIAHDAVRDAERAVARDVPVDVAELLAGAQALRDALADAQAQIAELGADLERANVCDVHTCTKPAHMRYCADHDRAIVAH